MGVDRTASSDIMDIVVFDRSRFTQGALLSLTSSFVAPFFAAMDIELEEYVLTPQNLCMFERWAAEADLEEIVEALQQIYIVDHRSPAWVEAIPSPDVIIDREDLGHRFVVHKMNCNDPQCQRCQTRRGGYQFRWVGPWTCPCIVGDETTTPMDLQRAHQNCRNCHPNGPRMMIP